MLPRNENRISGRSILLGICFVIAISWIVSYAELVITYIQIGFLQLPPAVIGLFFFLVLGNRLLERLNSRFGLSPRGVDGHLLYDAGRLDDLIAGRDGKTHPRPHRSQLFYQRNE